MNPSIKKDGKYKYGDGEPEPYETLELDQALFSCYFPIQCFFETLCKSKDQTQRDMGEIGLSLLRDCSNARGKLEDAIYEKLGMILIDVDASGEEEGIIEPYEYPDYLGVRLEPIEKKKEK